MKRLVLWLLTGLSVALAACVPHASFEPACGSTAADTTKTEVVAVIGDGYAAGDDRVFRANVSDLVCDALFKDPVYARHRNRFSIVVARHVSNVSKVGNTKADTAFKTIFNGSPAQCNFTETPDSVALIRQAVEGVRGLRSIVVLVHADGAGGYANGDLIYVASRSSRNIAPHEYGHRAGLYDENTVVATPYNGSENLDHANCSTDCNPKTVWWRSAAETHPQEIGVFYGCLYHTGNICRPSKACRMLAAAEPFSSVCGGLVGEYLEHGNIGRSDTGTVPEGSTDTEDVVRGDYHQFLVSVVPGQTSPTFSATEQTGGFRPQVRPMSDAFYAVMVGDQVLFAESVRSQSPRTRCYPGLDIGAPHEGESNGGVLFVARLPKSVLGTINRDTLELRLYQSAPFVRLNAVTAKTVQPLIRDGQASPMTPPVVVTVAR